ncbi:hypothetical protein, partial [Phormidium sp. CCY1219]|uniref:hypothetical protein n=1 Tax=Phormidium sp. CCY1219 TaxID=2886104 RepID=UPI002D1F0BD0
YFFINKPFPEEFISFWYICPNSFSTEEIQKMYYSNHIFYLALTKGIFTEERFNKEILKPLVEKTKSFAYYEPIILKWAFFRENTTPQDPEHIIPFFKSFVTDYFDLINQKTIKVIDIKYSSLQYYLQKENMETIKKRSVRKQFVYEYLIQQKLKKSYPQFSGVNICSQFVLPGYKQASVYENHPNFMKGYIELMTLDFETVADRYLS